MRLPTIIGVIERRILANYRLDPEVVAKLLPAPFEPLTFKGFAVAGICMIRLAKIRPRRLPAVLGLKSENAAHRFAVTWVQDGVRKEGVFVPRRDTSSCLVSAAGGRVFPGVQHHASFAVDETAERLDVGLRSKDGELSMAVVGRYASQLPSDSIFDSLGESSRFFEGGGVGWSATRDPERFDGMELKCEGWRVEALAVEQIRSSYFDDPERFPAGSVAFDHALVMRDIDHSWHGLCDLCA